MRPSAGADRVGPGGASFVERDDGAASSEFFAQARVQCMIPNGPGIDVRPHNKEILIDGAYDGDITPRVYTGSPNLDGSSLRSSDEALVRITDAGYHARYLSTFYKIRTACGG